MFEKIKDYFEGKQDLTEAVGTGSTVSPQDLVVAACVLLVEVAGIDSRIDPTEGTAVVQALSDAFGVPQGEVPEFVQLAIAAKKEKGKIKEFIELLNENFSEEQRLEVLALVWKVVFADGAVEEEEEKLANFMGEKLGLSKDQVLEAYQEAARSR
jgi:uncharacterized tellurite resistance protein B-like protein